MRRKNQPDFSNYLAHFTTSRSLVSRDGENPAKNIEPLTAKE